MSRGFKNEEGEHLYDILSRITWEMNKDIYAFVEALKDEEGLIAYIREISRGPKDFPPAK